MQNRKFILFYLFFITTSFQAFSEKWELIIQSNKNDAKILNKVDYKSTFQDSLTAILEINKIINSLHHESYLLAFVDSVVSDNLTISATIHIGSSYKWLQLVKGNMPEGILSKVNYKEKIFRNKKFEYTELIKFENNVLEYAENNGFPFARIKIDSVKITKDNQIFGVLNFKKGPQIVFDSIEVIGKSKIKYRFLASYLQITKRSPYDERKIKNADEYLKRLNIVKITRKSEVRFTNGKAKTYLFLEDKKTNYVDGIVGLQQDPNLEGKMLFTGEFDIKLRNMAGTGKAAGFHWRKTDRFSQQLDLNYQHPSLFRTGINFNFTFNLLKQDTTFLTVNPRFEFTYNIGKRGLFGVFYENKNSRLSSPKQFEFATELPPFADIKLNYYGLNYEWHNLDDYYFPRKGLLIWSEGSIGLKKISKTLSPELYDGIKLNTTQYNVDSKIEYHLKINDLLTVMGRAKGGIIENEAIFFNDMYRLGGINSLRGFREYTFYASSYNINSLEVRFFTEAESYLLVFVDAGFFETQTNTGTLTGMPIGFGAGLSFSTKAGVFNMVYALGKEQGSPTNLNSSVINFGLVSKF